MVAERSSGENESRAVKEARGGESIAAWDLLKVPLVAAAGLTTCMPAAVAAMPVAEAPRAKTGPSVADPPAAAAVAPVFVPDLAPAGAAGAVGSHGDDDDDELGPASKTSAIPPLPPPCC